MANSTSISKFKQSVINAITHDKTLFYAFDAQECENAGDLENTHIFSYNKSPETITEAITFLAILVNTNTKDDNRTFVIPTLEICIYTHNDHMKMDTAITKDNRNDYISILLDKKFNGSDEYGGIGQLELVSNTEGSYNKDFLFRRLVFETIDVNNSFCP